MPELETIIAIALATVRAGTPLVFAALGELITEKSGVLNLGVEGMMLVGAVAGFAGVVVTGSILVGLIAAMLAGMLLSLIFGVLTLTLQSNQVATGLALTIFGIGLSAFVGLAYIGTPIKGLQPIEIPGLTSIPVIGPLLFGHDLLVYASLLVFGAVAWFLYKSRAGLILRAVGESHEAAHALGYSVIKIRYLAVMFGGAMSGLGGAYLSLAYTPQWAENMTAGRGWIALALVVFSAWRPWRLLLGAYFFGAVMTLELHAKAAGMSYVAPEFLAAMPYLATIAVLALISLRKSAGAQAPACLGQPFKPTA